MCSAMHYPDSLALYQPVYLFPRDDIDPSECLVF
jgi:hypothetical protein